MESYHVRVSNPAAATISEKLLFSSLFEPKVVGYPTTHANGKTPADARKRGVLGNQFIGNIPTANPRSIPQAIACSLSYPPSLTEKAWGLRSPECQFDSGGGCHHVRIAPMDRIAGFDPADEGSSPSPNTFRADNRELLLKKPLGHPLARFRGPSEASMPNGPRRLTPLWRVCVISSTVCSERTRQGAKP